MAYAVTQQEIADKAGASRTAVSKVLAGKAQNSRISAELSQRILDAAKQLNYRPHAAARAMRPTRSMQVAIVTTSYGDRRFEDSLLPLIMGVNDRLVESSYTGVLVRVNELERHLSKQSRVFAEHAVDGVVAMNTVTEAAVDRLLEACRPVNCTRPFKESVDASKPLPNHRACSTHRGCGAGAE